MITDFLILCFEVASYVIIFVLFDGSLWCKNLAEGLLIRSGSLACPGLIAVFPTFGK